MKKFICVQPEPLGMYVTDANNLSRAGSAPSFWVVHRDIKYLPILNSIHISCDNQVRLTSGESITADITVYNEGNSLKRFSDDVIRTSKLDVTPNDLLLGPVEIGLNFTGKNLTVTSRSGVPKSFSPLTLKSFTDLEGKFAIMTVHTLNSISAVHAKYGETNYIKRLRDKLSARHDHSSKELTTMYDCVLQCYASGKHSAVMEQSETYKVATITVVDVADLLQGERDKTVLHLLQRDIEITYSDPTAAPLHECLTRAYATDREVLESLREHGVSCFIVDNDSHLGDRFFNFMGEVRKVPVIRKDNMLQGLYIVSIDKGSTVQMDNFTDMQAIDKAPGIYKSMEEASRGANIREQYVNEVEMRKLDKVSETLEERLKFEADMRDLQKRFKEQEVLLAETDRRNRLKFEDALHSLRLEAESRKNTTEEYKFNYDKTRFHMDNAGLYAKREYEQAKYERDGTIETIKTVGAIAGLLAGGYALYSKFAK